MRYVKELSDIMTEEGLRRIRADRDNQFWFQCLRAAWVDHLMGWGMSEELVESMIQRFESDFAYQQ